MLNQPTKERPVLLVANGVIEVSRGLEVVDAAGDLSWISAHDGPCLRIHAPGYDRGELIIPFVGDDGSPSETPGELISAILLCCLEKAAAPGAHDEELELMGLKAVPR